MHLGIDLGTSNSAVAGNAAAELRIFKTAEGTDVLPSVIYIDKRGHRFVGGRAYDHAMLSPDNAAQGFKRLMGTSTPISFGGAQISMTPEEASAEILKTLLGQVHTEAGAMDIQGTIVTIPAAFNQMQSEATIRAAQMAGIERVGLLQEPIAAAMASMAQAKNKNGQFLVYDLGGGTFDVALVQSVGGQVNVVAHEGINMLGGRDFDRTIVNSLVRPWLLDNFSLPDDFQKDPRFQRLIRMATARAEQAKIELSTKESTSIFVNDEEARVTDASGADIYIEVQFDLAALERLISDRIDDTVHLCRKVLKDNGYSHEDIDRVVFIGGPSKMPAIRNRVPQELGIPADLQADPMTAVAVGASIFAESRDWSGAATSRKSSRGSTTVKGSVEFRYDYPARTSDDRARIRLKPSAEADGTGYRAQLDTPAGWSSGQVDVTDGAGVEVPLSSRGENRIRITIFDPSGAPVESASTILSITRTFASAAGIPATQATSVKVIEGVIGHERNALEPLVEKGTTLPAEGNKTFRAARDLRGGDDAHIDFELYQQAPGVPEPELNLFVGSFRISGIDIAPGEAIRKGDELVCRWRMDDNGLLSCNIEVPATSQTFNAGRYYADAAGHRNFEGESGAEFASAVVREAEAEVSKAETALGESAKEEMSSLKQRLRRQQELLAHSHDADARRAVTEEARLVRQDLSRIKHKPEHRGAALIQELDGILSDYDRFCREYADAKSSARMDQLTETVRHGVAKGDRHNLETAERSIHEMRTLLMAELFQLPSYLVHIFRNMAEERYLAVDKKVHAELVAEGEAAIANNDVATLRRTLGRLWDNQFQVGGNAAVSMAGLMRA